MAAHLDLEEQEQLDQLKHFWKQWGNLISWVLIVALGAVAAWNGYSWWQRSQASKAAGLYDEFQRAMTGREVDRIERALSDLQTQYGRTLDASHASLQAAHTLLELSKPEAARVALAWVADKSPDAGLSASARLQLASLLLDSKAYDEAMKQLAGSFPPEYEALLSDRRGDVLLAQGKKTEAATEFGRAYVALEKTGGEYRRLVGVKLNALGIDPGEQAARAPAPGASK